MHFSNIKVKQKILLGIFSPLLLLIVLTGTVFFALDRLDETEHWVAHTQKVITNANSIITSAINIETGMRGYLLTGQQDYLEPYEKGSQLVYHQLEELRNLVKDNQPQVAQLWEAETILHEWQDSVTQPSIALRRVISREKGIHDMAQLAEEQKSLHYTNKIDNQINQFIEEEKHLLKARIEALRSQLNMEDLLFNDPLEQITGWTNRTQLTIDQAHQTASLIKDMETAIRGYLLSGTEQLLKPYHQGEEQFEKSFKQLTLLVSDNPSQLQLLEEIAQNVEAWDHELIHPMIELRREISSAKTMDDMAELVATGRGKLHFDNFRGVMAEFTEEEERLMALRKTDAKTTTQWVYLTILLCTLGSLLIGGSLSYMIGRNISIGITQMADALRRLSSGDKTTIIPGSDRKDEIGEMAFAADIFKAHLDRIEQLSITDELTGLYNRRKFNTDFPQELNRAQRDKKSLALLILDIDHFKHYNDTYGHQEGDKVLQTIGETMKQTFLRAGDFSYRLGGEEFGVLLSSSQPHELKTMAERIRINIEALGIPHAHNTAAPVVTTSIGMMIVSEDHTETPNAIYRATDDALYRAKEAGRNRVVIT